MKTEPDALATARQRTRMTFTLALLGAAWAGCTDSPTEPGPSAVRVTVPFDSLMVGEAATLRADVLDGSGAIMQDESVSWTSDDPTVATVTPEGVVRGVGRGGATISASAEGIVENVTFDVVLRPVDLADLLANGVSFELDPSGYAPLSAQIRFETLDPALVSLTVMGRTAEANVEWSAEAPASEHVLPVLGPRVPATSSRSGRRRKRSEVSTRSSSRRASFPASFPA